MTVEDMCNFKCPYIYLEQVVKWSGIAPCDTKLEINGHMYPGSGLQTGIGFTVTGYYFSSPPPYIS